MTSSGQADYQAAGFAGELGFGERPAVVLIDLMMCYFDRSSPMYADVEDVLASSLRLVNAARARQVPVFFTRQLYEEVRDDGAYVRKVPALKLLRPGSSFAELHPALPLDQGEVLIKHYPSALHRTRFGAQLADMRIDTLIIGGLTTSGCVRATAMDSLLMNLRGIVVREAVGDRSNAVHDANLFDIDGKLADVRTEEEVVHWLTKRAVGARAM
jgi:maleamate amidohydrolase